MASFHPFPRLPTELRAQIWEATAEPRTVDVRYRLSANEPPMGLTSSTAVPAILHSCREARSIGPYKKVFSEIAMPEKGMHYIWANLGMDTINIRQSLLRDFKLVAPAIRRLRLAREMRLEDFFSEEVKELRLFANIEEIYVDVIDGIWNAYWAFEDSEWPCGPENVSFIDYYEPGPIYRGYEGMRLIQAIDENEELDRFFAAAEAEREKERERARAEEKVRVEETLVS